MNCRLQELCEVGVAIDICNDPEVKRVIFTSSKYLLKFTSENNNIEEFESWYGSFLKEISHIFDNFPHWLLGKIKYLIPVISIEMIKWARFHKETFLLSFEFSQAFISRSIFTTTGIIDREKAARALMEERSLRPSTLFWIGSYYGLSDEALKFWTQVPDFEIASLRSGNTVVLWVDLLLGHNKGTNFSYDVLKAAVDSGSEVSFCYFWKDLDEETKKEAINYFAQTFLKKLKLWKKTRKCVDFMYVCEPYIGMFKYLVKDLDIEKIKTLLNEHKLTYLVLTYMLHWPYQSSFLETAKLLMEILSKYAFHFLLLDIILKINDPFVAQLYDYRVLFGKFWNESSEDVKRSLFSFETVLASGDEFDIEFYFGSYLYRSRTSFGYLILLKLFIRDFTDVDEQNVRSLFVNVELSELRRIELTFGKDICNVSIKNGNFRCADLFLECCKVADLKGFKRNLVSTGEFQMTLEDLLLEFKLDLIDEILKWALIDTEYVMFKQKLCVLMSINLPLNVGEKLITIPSEEGSEFSNSLTINVSHFVRNFKQWLINDEFDKADKFLKWIFPTLTEIDDYKRELAKEWSKSLDIVSEWANSRSEFHETNSRDIDLKKNILYFCQTFQL